MINTTVLVSTVIKFPQYVTVVQHGQTQSQIILIVPRIYFSYIKYAEAVVHKDL